MDLEFYLNDLEIEIDGSVIAPLSYSVADVKSPEKRSRNRSKSIKVKGTQNNLKVLSSAYNLSLKDSAVGFNFNPNDEITAKIKRNGLIIFDGVANFIETELHKGVYSFTFQVFGKVVGIFESLKDKSLAELGWSEYNHDLTIANIELSWDTSVEVNGTPTSNFTAGVPDGFGYLYGLINFGYAANQLSPKGNELIPYFYVKEAFEKCFAVGGYTVGGSWISSNFVRRVTFGLGGGDRILLSSGEIAARLIDYTAAGSVSITTTSNNTFNAPVGQKGLKYFASQIYTFADISPYSTTLVTDSRTQFDESTGLATIGSTGNYSIEVDVALNVSNFGFDVAVLTESEYLEMRLNVLRNGSVISANQAFATSTGALSLSINIQSFLYSGDTLEFKLQHIAKWQCTVSATPPYPVAELDYATTSVSFTVTSINGVLQEGNTVDVGRWMPDMKCSDFIKDIITMNNLYFSDPDDDGDIRVETFNDYYGDTDDAENYSKKLDYTKPIIIKTNAGIDGKTYNFKFAEDRDAWKDYYFKTWGSDYGDLSYTVPTTFKKNEKKYELKFAQTIPIIDSGVVIPQIIKRDPITNLASPYKGKPRIFLYNGLKTGNWNLLNSTTGAATAQTSYPQFHHLSSLTNPTFDLNFGVPIETYFNATSYTTNNMFSRNYETQINELTSIDSKFISAYFKIDERDLQGEFMSRLVNIDGVIYRKNIINDFDATGFQTTNIELIKVLEARSRQALLITAVSNNAVSKMSNNPQPSMGDINATDQILGKLSERFMKVDSSGGSISVILDTDVAYGTQFTIQREGANTVFIQTIDTSDISGQSNIPLNNDYDSVTVLYTSTGYVVLNFNSALLGKGSVESISINTSTDVGVETYEADTSGGDVVVTLTTTGTPKGKIWNVKKMDAANMMTVDTESGTIDGVADVDVFDSQTSLSFQFDGTNFIII